jgi:hypothetical protein
VVRLGVAVAVAVAVEDAAGGEARQCDIEGAKLRLGEGGRVVEPLTAEQWAAAGSGEHGTWVG